jgi:hypothetical protein
LIILSLAALNSAPKSKLSTASKSKSPSNIDYEYQYLKCHKSTSRRGRVSSSRESSGMLEKESSILNGLSKFFRWAESCRGKKNFSC